MTTLATELTTATTVGQLVAERPSRARFFERLGIDYCCGGKKPLAEVCAVKGLDASTILQAMLAAEAGEEQRGSVDPAAMTLTALADHIEATHHAYLRAELPRLTQITEKVARVHGAHDRRLELVAAVFATLREEMEAHMPKEEQILFPLIRRLESAGAAGEAHCGSIANPIRVMESEHESAGQALAELRTLTDGFTPPSYACNTYRAMLDGLQQLESDLHQHVHKENNILFPRAIKLEASLTGSAH